MKKILVTTDLSNKSKAGIRFAIQLASQGNFNLTFFHAYHILSPVSWHDDKIKAYEKFEANKLVEKLNLFVSEVYKAMNLIPGTARCVIQSSTSAQTCIMEYATRNKFNFICLSSRGAGKLERFFGTNTANIITQSEIPVIAVPHNYKISEITGILYASDLINLEKELKKVAAFAKPLKATIELLHFTAPLETIMDFKIIEMAAKKFARYNIKLNIKKADFVKTLITNIETAVKDSKPSLMIMFTEQNRSLFQQIFHSSRSAEYSYDVKIPLLVFNKS